MKKQILKISLIATALLASISSTQAAVTVIAHEGVPVMDEATLARVYMGKAIEVAGVVITPVNLPAGTGLRSAFMNQVVGKDDDAYIAYWVVRRSIGKGAPPRELNSTAAMLDYVKSTPGAIGYIDSTELKPGVKVLLK